MDILISGGGIAGLSAAIFLSRLGMKVNVFENTHTVEDLGTGVQISPNGYKILESLNVTERINTNAFQPENVHIRDGISGEIEISVPVKYLSEVFWGGKYLNIKRFDLVKALSAELSNSKLVKIYYGKRVVKYEQSSTRVTVFLQDGSEFSGDFLIGADGVFSKISQQMFSSARFYYSGNVAWRALVKAPKIEDSITQENNCIWVGPKKHAVTTVLGDSNLINFVGVIEKQLRGGNLYLDDPKKNALLDFHGWNRQLVSIIETAEIIHQWPIYKAKPFERWSDKNVVIIGDAAHPMVPSMAQGASQALEDAAVLASTLKQSSDIQKSFHNFYKSRINRTRKVQSASLRNLMTFHISNYYIRKIMYIGARQITKVTSKFLMNRLNKIYSYTVDT